MFQGSFPGIDRTPFLGPKMPILGNVVWKHVWVLFKSSKWKTIDTYKLFYVKISLKNHGSLLCLAVMSGL